MPKFTTEALSQPKPRVHAIIFDFDYTLADSSRGVIACFNFAFGKLGLPLADDAMIRQTIGLTLRRFPFRSIDGSLKPQMRSYL